MSTFTTASGLGIDLAPRTSSILSSTAPPSPRSSRATTGSSSSTRNLLLGAELGDAMVALDPASAQLMQGQRIALATPGGGERPAGPNPHLVALRAAGTVNDVPSDGIDLARRGTLLGMDNPPARTAAELAALLGNANAKLKSRATPGLVLEQAVARARVSLDVQLASPVCVQGSFLCGRVSIRVRGHARVQVAREGRVRVVGFEGIQNRERFVFYHVGGRLQGCLWRDGEVGDEEGFGEAKEGVHVLPFKLLLPLESPDGDAKGPLKVHGDVTVRYIALASIQTKDPKTGKKSLAHFYRAISVYPRLDPSLLLRPAARPLYASTSKSLFLGGSGKVQLTAMLHRLHFVAGQRCWVHVHVVNETKKTVRRVSLTLQRRTVIFRPRPELDAGDVGDVDADACQTVTMEKAVAESVLEMGDKATRGHASARGWWTGVGRRETAAFEHFITIPAEALSVPRGRLIEVEYRLVVSLGAGMTSADVQAELPLRIVNFLSVDPPYCWPLEAKVIARTESRPIIGTEPQIWEEDTDLVGGCTPRCESREDLTEVLATVQEEHSQEEMQMPMLSRRGGTEEGVESAYDGMDEYDGEVHEGPARFCDLYYKDEAVLTGEKMELIEASSREEGSIDFRSLARPNHGRHGPSSLSVKERVQEIESNL